MKFVKIILLLAILATPAVYSQTEVSIPNIFTPDGDGANDRFHIISSGYSDLTCTIYNRFGEVVYRFYGVDGSWDGYTHAGVKVDPGVYFVFLQLTTTDGQADKRQGTLEVLWR